MKRFIFVLAIMAVAGTSAKAQTQTQEQEQVVELTKGKVKLVKGLNGKTLYVVDGKLASKDSFEKLSPEEIKSMEVVKGIEAAIVVTTKSPVSEASAASGQDGAKYWVIKGDKDSVAKTNDGPVIRLRGEKKENVGVAVNPLIVVKNAKGEMTIVKDIKEIKPETIKAITVFKDSKTQEFKQYGDITYGVIYIELL